MENRYIFREATLSDITEVAQILKDAVDRMLAEGKCQWDENYPTAVHVLADIEHHAGYVIELNDHVLAYGAVVFTGEPAYDLLDGEWQSDEAYVVVHRLAVAAWAQGRGTAKRFLAATEHLAAGKGIGSFRIDTNFDNERMLGLLEKCGFTHCGEVRYPSGPRLAFEKLI